MSNGITALFSVTLLLCVLLQTFSEAKPKPFPESVIKVLSKRNSRLHHYTWHVVRDYWTLLTPEQQQELRDIGWDAPRPALRYDENGTPIAIMDNNAGEDFLYMHQQMIHEVNRILKENREPYGKVVGWKNIPAPGDKDWPVPPPYEIPGDPDFGGFMHMIKDDGFYYGAIKPMEELFKNPAELKKMTLGEMGTRIESTIHGWLHMRWSEASTVGYREKISLNNALKPIDKVWENEKYNWLGDPFASHVHPTFYMLHGWIDDRIEDWRKAHGLCKINWTGTWVGGPMTAPCGDKKPMKTDPKLRGTAPEDDGVDEALEKVCRIFNKAGIGKNRFDCNVILDEKK